MQLKNHNQKKSGCLIQEGNNFFNLYANTLSMKIHLIRTENVDFSLLQEVVELLSQFKGCITYHLSLHDLFFKDNHYAYQSLESLSELHAKRTMYYNIIDEQVNHSKHSLSIPSFPFRRKKKEGMNDLFVHHNLYRNHYDVGDNELVILLTDIANPLNWFSYGDCNNNAYIYTDEWEYYIASERKYPIAYQVVSNILQLLMFDNDKEMMSKVHHKSVGCINDFCEDKRQIVMKMKMTDICLKCQDLLRVKKIKPSIINQSIETMFGIRSKMLSVEMFRSSRRDSNIVFCNKGNPILIDIDHYEVKLTPLERTLYHFFIRHKEGVKQIHLADYKDELKSLYLEFSGQANLANITNSINMLVDIQENSFQEKLSKIRRKFQDVFGDDGAYKKYVIVKYEDERYAIKIDRSLINENNLYVQ